MLFDTALYIYILRWDYENRKTDEFVGISHIDNDKSMFLFTLLLFKGKKEKLC